VWVLVTHLFWNLVSDSFFRALIKKTIYMDEVDDKGIENEERLITLQLMSEPSKAVTSPAV